MLFYCCATADILTKLLQQYFLIFIVVPWLYLGNSQVSVYRTIGPTLVSFIGSFVFKQQVLFRVDFLSLTLDYRVQCPRVGLGVKI